MKYLLPALWGGNLMGILSSLKVWSLEQTSYVQILSAIYQLCHPGPVTDISMLWCTHLKRGDKIGLISSGC